MCGYSHIGRTLIFFSDPAPLRATKTKPKSMPSDNCVHCGVLMPDLKLPCRVCDNRYRFTDSLYSRRLAAKTEYHMLKVLWKELCRESLLRTISTTAKKEELLGMLASLLNRRGRPSQRAHQHSNTPSGGPN
jgi:hypothetical protein